MGVPSQRTGVKLVRATLTEINDGGMPVLRDEHEVFRINTWT